MYCVEGPDLGSDSTSSSAVVDMSPERLYEHIRQRPPRNCATKVYSQFDGLNEQDPIELSGSYLVCMGKLEWLGYNLVKVA